MSGGVLIDTNVISEVRKGERCDANVSAWYASVPEADIFLSVLVLGEIRKGIERARGSNPVKAEALERWLRAVVEGFAHRIFGVANAGDLVGGIRWGCPERHRGWW